MRWLKDNTNYRMGTLLRGSGPLEPEFRQLGPTVTLGTSPLFHSRFGRRLRHYLPESVRDEIPRIRRHFLEGSYDLIYSNTITNGVALEALSAFEAPIISHVHELAYWIWRTGQENLRRVLARTSAFIAASDAVKQNLVGIHAVEDAKVTVVPEHIRELPSVPDIAQKLAARAALGIPAEAFVLGGCGGEHWRKGRDLVPQLLLNLRGLTNRDIHFVWIGRPGTEEEEFALQHDLRLAGVGPQFHNTGEVVDPLSHYAAIDAFALLSRDDPYPLACLEAAAMEIPIVCFAGSGGIPAMVTRDRCGFVAPYLDIAAMAQDIVRLIRDPQLCHSTGCNGRVKVARDSLIDATGPQLLEVMNVLLERRNGARSECSESSNLCPELK